MREAALALDQSLSKGPHEEGSEPDGQEAMGEGSQLGPEAGRQRGEGGSDGERRREAKRQEEVIMPKIKNVSPGIRHVNAVVDDAPATVSIYPGQELDVELVNPEDKVYRGLVDSGQLVEGGTETERAKLSQERQQLEEKKADLDRRESELSVSEEERKHQKNPMLRDARQAAAIAGHTPGLADPLPPGADTEGGEESKRALENMGYGEAHGTEETSVEEMAKGGPDRHLGSSDAPSREGADSNRSQVQRQARPQGSGTRRKE
jgi:hypothetical protein